MCCHPMMHETHSQPGEHQPPEPSTAAPARVRTAACPHCGFPAQEDFVFCPSCGQELLTACPACHRAVQADWARCAYCGADLLASQPANATHAGHTGKE